MISSEELPGRLRALRSDYGRKVSQGDIAKAFRVSTALISSWEGGRARPSDRRLEAYARLFSTSRSFADGHAHLLDVADLTQPERHRYEELKAELCGVPAPADPLRYGEDELVTIVCAPLPADMRASMPYADRLDPDHVELYTYADLDALFELTGYLRQVNPRNRFAIKLASDMDRLDLYTHLILLGGVDWNELTRHLLDTLPIPVTQVSRDGEAGAFEVVDHGEHRSLVPTLSFEGGRQVLREDVAHFCRAPNPYNNARTVTMFNGMYGRGTHGVVRALTDARFREANARYLERRFAGSGIASLICRVSIPGGIVATPDWCDPHARLHEWPAEKALGELEV